MLNIIRNRQGWVYDLLLYFFGNWAVRGVQEIEKDWHLVLFFSPGATQPIVGVYFTALCRAYLITYSDAPHSVGLLWTNDQSVAETSTWQHTTLTTDKHPCPGWDSNPRSQQASAVDLRLRPRGHCDRLFGTLKQVINVSDYYWMKTGREFIYKPIRKATGNDSKCMNPLLFIISCKFVV